MLYDYKNFCVYDIESLFSISKTIIKSGLVPKKKTTLNLSVIFLLFKIILTKSIVLFLDSFTFSTIIGTCGVHPSRGCPKRCDKRSFFLGCTYCKTVMRPLRSPAAYLIRSLSHELFCHRRPYCRHRQNPLDVVHVKLKISSTLTDHFQRFIL